MENRILPEQNDSFEKQMREMIADPRVQQMRRFSQHQGNTTYHHCLNVAQGSYNLAKFLHIKIDGKSLAVGAMLHDYYLYSTSSMDLSSYTHGVSHPQIALENAADSNFQLNEREINIIESHMWPLTLTHIPREREAVLVCIADKFCALQEMCAGSVRKAHMLLTLRKAGAGI